MDKDSSDTDKDSIIKELRTENAKLLERLEIDPGGTDKIDTKNMQMHRELAERSGSVHIHSHLVGFLYDLMRDHLSPGKVEMLVRNALDPDITYCNGWLAQYAEDVAKRLGDKPLRLKKDETAFTTSNLRPTFMDRAVAGLIAEADLSDVFAAEIDLWHESKQTIPPVQLHEWLGITREDYAKWIEATDATQADRHLRDLVALAKGGNHD